jgi:alanine dehydrogenase
MTETFDVDTLLAALKNENNETIMELDNDKIQNMKNNMLEKLNMPKKELAAMKKSLKSYRYIDELPELNFGAYVRWIPLKKTNTAKLTTGGFVCDVKIDEGINIVCKNNMNRHFQFKMGDCLIFQKLSDQEQVLLSAMKYLNE